MARPVKAVCAPVLGVHRSGTSVLASSLQAIGVPLGDIGAQVSAGNPTGFFESKSIRRLDDDLLRRLGVSWDNWAFDASRIDFAGSDLAPFRRRAAAIVRGLFGEHRLWSVKDPRMATLWPFWRLVLVGAHLELRPIVIIRDPREIAISQAARASDDPANHAGLVDAESIAALWCMAMINVTEKVGSQRVLVIDHAELIRAPDEMLARCARYLGVEVGGEAIAAAAAATVSRELHRSKASGSVAGAGPWMKLARRFFNALASAAADGDVPAEALEAVARRQRSLQTARQYAAVYAGLSHRTRRQAVERQHVRDLTVCCKELAEIAFEAAVPDRLADIRDQLDFLQDVAGESLPLMWQASLCSARAGDVGDAIRRLDRIIERYPDYEAAALKRRELA